VLAEQVKHSGSIFSVTLGYWSEQRMLNVQLVSNERVIPDIYTLLAGIGGERAKRANLVTKEYKRVQGYD